MKHDFVITAILKAPKPKQKFIFFVIKFINFFKFVLGCLAILVKSHYYPSYLSNHKSIMRTKRVLIFFIFFITLLNSTKSQAQAPYLGEIRMVAFSFAPPGWALCNGQILQVSQYPALFALLGTTYGGNGYSTFGLPDLRGRVPVNYGEGPGLSPVAMGQIWGASTTTLNTQNMPLHTHLATATANTQITIHASDEAGNTADPTNAYWANTGSLDREYNTTSNKTMNGAVATAVTTANVTVQPTGGSQPVNISPPSLGVNFIICLEGSFPPRP